VSTLLLSMLSAFDRGKAERVSATGRRPGSSGSHIDHEAINQMLRVVVGGVPRSRPFYPPHAETLGQQCLWFVRRVLPLAVGRPGPDPRGIHPDFTTAGQGTQLTFGSRTSRTPPTPSR
jgi:hypothetical protein